jgi:transcriptional regulator with XRE-family HTH domain
MSVASSAFEPIHIADWAWQRPETHAILDAKDMAGLLKFAQQYGGASQGRLAAATGISQGRINEVINGKRAVTQLDVFTRIADGLDMPDFCRITLGLAPKRGGRRDHATTEITKLFASQEPVAAEIRRRAADAHHLDVLAVRALGIIGLNDSVLRPTLLARKHPLKVRVLLLDPSCEAATVRAREIGESAASFGAGINLAIERLREVAGAVPNVDLQVSLYTRLPVWRIIRVDNTAYVSSFDAAWEGHASMIYEVPHTPRGAFWAGYRRHFDDVCDTARRVI